MENMISGLRFVLRLDKGVNKFKKIKAQFSNMYHIHINTDILEC